MTITNIVNIIVAYVIRKSINLDSKYKSKSDKKKL